MTTHTPRRGKQGGQPWLRGKAYALATSRLRTAHPEEFARLTEEAMAELEAADRDEVTA